MIMHWFSSYINYKLELQEFNNVFNKNVFFNQSSFYQRTIIFFIQFIAATIPTFFTAANCVVLEPKKGSNTQSPSSVKSMINRSINSTGNRAGCILLYFFPMLPKDKNNRFKEIKFKEMPKRLFVPKNIEFIHSNKNKIIRKEKKEKTSKGNKLNTDSGLELEKLKSKNQLEIEGSILREK